MDHSLPFRICHLSKKSFLLTAFIFLNGILQMISAAVPDSLVMQGTDTVYHLTRIDLKMGERLFYGLIREQGDQPSCVSCHDIKPVTTFNWNPSAFEIATAYRYKSTGDLKSALLKPVGNKLTEAHAGYSNLNDAQLVQLKGFLYNYYQQGGYKSRPLVNRLLMFSALVVVFILALLDLIWFRVVRYRIVHAAILLASAYFITRFTVVESIALGRSKNYEPDQPIKFSHAVHAGQNQINCLYCHGSAEYAKSAGIPSANVCVNCHMIVREGKRSGRFEISKIFTAIEQKQPVKWNRVYSLPDHVYFNHAQHVKAGKIDCLTCHGNVKQMDRISQVPDLSMGWCINCHRTTKVQFHDNQFYSSYEVLRKKVEQHEIDSVTVSMVGGTDCMKCHY